MIMGLIADSSSGKICSKHDKVEEYFCINDNENVCASCVILGKHKDH